jgi:hypothetical protein
MALFDVNSPLRTRRTFEYGSFTVLELAPNCTHFQFPIVDMKGF